MQPDYETVMEMSGLIWTMVPMVLHVLSLVAQLAVAGYLLLHGIALATSPEADPALLRRLGRVRPEGVGPRAFGGVEIAGGALALAPLALGVPWPVSSLACALVLAAVLLYGGAMGSVGRLARGAAAFAAFFTLAFMTWERADPLDLASGILFKAVEWRNHELAWQLDNDVESPKVGDLAPDFELADPNAEKTIRLSSFFGKRPVALVFGSYT